MDENKDSTLSVSYVLKAYSAFQHAYHFAGMITFDLSQL